MLFGIAAAVSVLTLVSVLLVREVPLRTTVEKAPDAELAGAGAVGVPAEKA